MKSNDTINNNIYFIWQWWEKHYQTYRLDSKDLNWLDNSCFVSNVLPYTSPSFSVRKNDSAGLALSGNHDGNR